MDGDFAPMVELAKLRRKYGFLLVLDDVSQCYIQESVMSLCCTHGIWPGYNLVHLLDS